MLHGSMRPVRTDRLERGAIAVVLVLGAIGLFRFVHLGLRALAFRFPLDYGEGPILDQAVRLAHGQSIYRAAFESPPYAVANYPPGFLLWQVPFVHRFGPALWYGRAVELVSALAVVLLLGATTARLTGDRLAGLVASLLFVAVPPVANWAPLDRVDIFALALSWAAVHVALGSGDSRPGAARVASVAALLLASAYTKQTYVLVAPAAVFVWWWGGGFRRQAVAFVVGLAAVGLAAFVAMDAATHHGFFVDLVSANATAYTLAQLGRFARDLAIQMPVLLAALVSLPVLARRGRAFAFVATYCGTSLMGALTVGHVGSAVNHLLELCTAMALASGILLADLRPRRRMAFAVALAGQMVVLVLYAQRSAQLPRWRILGRASELARIENVLCTPPGPVLADEWMGLLPLCGKEIYVQPFEMTQGAQRGLWDPSLLARDVGERRFPVIAIFHDPFYPSWTERWPACVLAAIDRSYRPTERIADTIIYRPAP